MIVEKNIYILIDTSKHMQAYIQFIKDKLRLLIQVPLRFLSRFHGCMRLLLGSTVGQGACQHGRVQHRHPSMARSIDKNQSLHHAQSTRLLDRRSGSRRIDQHTRSTSLCPGRSRHGSDLSPHGRPTGSGETSKNGRSTPACTISVFRMSATFFRKCSIDKLFRYIPLHSTVEIRQRTNFSLI